MACVIKNTGLCRLQLQQCHWPVLAKILACVGHITLKIMACVSHNSSNITGLCQKKYWLASATSLTCVRKILACVGDELAHALTLYTSFFAFFSLLY